jgi:hypothetical protein
LEEESTVLKKTLLGLAILLTASNLAAVAVYAGVCQSTGGSRACGQTCVTQPTGSCNCEGSCTADELKWVAGGGGHAALEEELDY